MPRLNVHSNYHRIVAAVIAVYPFAIGAIAAPWPAAVVVAPAGALVVWRVAFVRLAGTDDGQLLVRNVFVTRRFAADDIDRLTVDVARFDTRGHSRLIVVHRKPGGRLWYTLKRVQCAASMTFSSRRAQAICLALAAWAEAQGVRCDADPHQLVSGFSSLVPVTPRDRCDALLASAARRLHRELHHGGEPHRVRERRVQPETTVAGAIADPGATVKAAYQLIEAEARRIAARGGIEEADLHRLVLRMLSARLVHRSAAASIEEVVAVHRMVSRGELTPTASQARRYVDLVDDELIALRLPPGPGRPGRRSVNSGAGR